MFLIDRRHVHYFDWISFFIVVALTCIGLLFIFSTTYTQDVLFSPFFKKQLFGVISGLIIYLLFCFWDFRAIMRWGYFAYVGVIILLVFTMVKGSVAMGGQRWINLGFGIKAQPSELAKLLFPAFVSYYFFTQKETFEFALADYFPVIGTLAVSALLIRKQPDLGTALILLFSGLVMLWIANFPKKYFLIGLSAILVCAPLAWHALKDYQKQRIMVFLGYGDMRKERYQIEQSKIAIGSGGVMGKGLLRGTQNRLHFLPESRTDCIFSVIAEEWGFLGALLVLLLYGALFIRMLIFISTLKFAWAQLLAVGIMIHILLSTLINIGMVCGMLPVVGIPLPLISYGLSNLWITLASLGWFNGIAMRRYSIGG